ncbi:MAG TPA: GNAT family N-acetyltransferase [Caldilineaceae bacterium]|nr:GNAT family N-acetyltransferase [Caldilineaceae bacterium]
MPPTLESERLTLRPFLPSDTDAAYAVFEGHPDVWRFDPGFQRTPEQRRALIEKYAATNEPDGVGTLAVTLRTDHRLIGYVGLQLYVLPREPLATPEVELYYKMGRLWWGQGFAHEACQAMLHFAFGELRLARIVTITQWENEHSLRLLRKLGAQIETVPPRWAPGVMATITHPSS